MNLKQLAGHLGLSQATVSRALNNYPGTRLETRARVLAAAERFGYRASSIARGLATGQATARSGNIGIVFPVGSSLLLDPHFLEFLIGATQFAATQDMCVNLSTPARADEMGRYPRMIRQRQADGFILNGPTLDDPRLAMLQEMRVPFVVHGRYRADTPYAWLDIDNEGAIRRATQLLIQLGHRRITLIGAPVQFTFAADRESGYRQGHAESGIGVDPALVFAGQMTEENGYRFASQALAASPRPTAFLCSSMLSALGTMRALSHAGLRVPQDCSVIAHDDVFPYVSAEGMHPALTTTRSPIREHGRRLAEILGQIAEGALPVDHHELLDVDLVVRDSTAQCRT